MSSASSSATLLAKPPPFRMPVPTRRSFPPRPFLAFVPKCLAKELHFNRDFSATKRLQAGVDLVADLVGVTLGPKGRNVVLQNKYGPPKIVNDGETVLKEVELEDPLENIGVKLVRQAGAKTNDLAGDGSTTSVVLAQGLIAEGVKVLAAGMNPVQVARGIEKTARALVSEIQSMSREVEDSEIADVAAVSAGNDYSVGNMVAEAPLLIVGESVEQEALAPIIRNKLRGLLKVAVIKAPAFGERKSHYLDDIAILTGGTVVRDDVGLSLEKVGKEVLGSASKVVVSKDSTLLVTDGSTQDSVEKRIKQIASLVENTKETFKKKILSERIARLSSGVAILQVGAPTEVELKNKMLRVEDALNATKAAIEEGVVVGGGCSLLRLSLKVDDIKNSLDNEEQKVGADIFKRALSYPTKLIAKNAGVNGSVVIQKILSSNDNRYGYNAAKDSYEDLMGAGILDPSKVVRCCVEHAASVAKTFLTSDVVVVDTREPYPATMRPRMPTSGPMPSFGHTPTFSPLPSRSGPKSTPFSPLGSKTTPGAMF